MANDEALIEPVQADLLAETALAGRLNEVFFDLQARGEFKGSVLVTRGSQTLYSASFGEGHTIATRQSVNSITKGFVGNAFMLLADDDNPNFTRASFDAPITNWLTEYRGDRKWERVTVRQLLNHESSIPDLFEHPTVAWNFFWDVPMTTRDVLDKLHTLPMRAPAPGTAYEYVQTNYLLGARLVEAISGTSFSTFLKNRVFARAGMSNSTDGIWPDLRAAGTFIVGYKNGVAVYGPADVYPMTYLAGAGSMFSTVQDLNRWSRALFDETLLTREQQDYMLEHHDTTGPGKTPGHGYGLGFLNGAYRGYAVHTNGGAGTNGFAGNIIRWLDEDVTLVIQTNLYAPNSPQTVPYRNAMGAVDCRILNAIVDYAIEGNATSPVACVAP